MRRNKISRIATIVASSLLCLGCNTDIAVAPDLAITTQDEAITTEIDGEWTVLTIFREGTEQPLDSGPAAINRFLDGRWYPGRNPSESTPYQLNTDTNPKQIEITPGDSPPMLGLYSLSGDELVLVFNAPGQPRPDRLDDTETPPYYRMTFSRTP